MNEHHKQNESEDKPGEFSNSNTVQILHAATRTHTHYPQTPFSAKKCLTLAEEAFSRKNFSVAVRWYALVLFTEPLNKFVLSRSTECFLHLNQAHLAVTSYLTLIRLAFLQNEFEQVKQYMLQILTIDPNYQFHAEISEPLIEHFLELASEKFTAQDYDQAIHYYDFILKLDSIHFDALLGRAYCNYEKQNFAAIIDSCLILLKLISEGMILTEEENIDEDEDQLSNVLELLSDSYLKLKQFTNALTYCKKAIESDPQEIEYKERLAECYFELKEYQNCIAQCNLILQEQNTNRRALMYRTFSFLKTYEEILKKAEPKKSKAQTAEIFEKAREDFTHLLSLSISKDVLMISSRFFLQEKYFDWAHKMAEKLLQVDFQNSVGQVVSSITTSHLKKINTIKTLEAIAANPATNLREILSILTFFIDQGCRIEAKAIINNLEINARELQIFNTPEGRLELDCFLRAKKEYQSLQTKQLAFFASKALSQTDVVVMTENNNAGKSLT
ncbi:tetratricopeptide repeat protein [Legionella septentrionalis]|uniref:tetratricopeptide repeat protein n=1 Tax=Legionella septentrionalis TaxID=2498109 RepID=UPI000F8F38DF|nr:tetratricopeptide repeat protein [Legionella septentrionalis]RUR15959.1 tetratricopeptide repeat protein [Legionella septentrionalis]